MKKINKLKRKLEQAKQLSNKALKNKFVAIPSNSYKYLQDVDIGEFFETQSKMGGILIDLTQSCATVIVTRAGINTSENDKNFYLGKQRWGLETEVKIIGE